MPAAPFIHALECARLCKSVRVCVRVCESMPANPASCSTYPCRHVRVPARVRRRGSAMPAAPDHWQTLSAYA
eukprot:365164-Chlamydomonas_euryale.AAC.8